MITSKHIFPPFCSDTNYATSSGEAIFSINPASIYIYNCIIAFNRCINFGGGAYLNGTSSTIWNSTIANNSGTYGGIYATPALTVLNSIVWNNVGTDINANVTVNCIEG